jgi:hypothetical protein
MDTNTLRKIRDAMPWDCYVEMSVGTHFPTAVRLKIDFHKLGMSYKRIFADIDINLMDSNELILDDFIGQVKTDIEGRTSG